MLKHPLSPSIASAAAGVWRSRLALASNLFGHESTGGSQGHLFGSKSDDDGVWRTVNGAHVFIKDGVIQKGPHNLAGKTLKEVHEAPQQVTANRVEPAAAPVPDNEVHFSHEHNGKSYDVKAQFARIPPKHSTTGTERALIHTVEATRENGKVIKDPWVHPAMDSISDRAKELADAKIQADPTPVNPITAMVSRAQSKGPIADELAKQGISVRSDPTSVNPGMSALQQHARSLDDEILRKVIRKHLNAEQDINDKWEAARKSGRHIEAANLERDGEQKKAERNVYSNEAFNRTRSKRVSAQVVDPSRQLGMFAKNSDGLPMEVGEKSGQTSMFGNNKLAPATEPKAPSDVFSRIAAKFDPKATPSMFENGEPSTAEFSNRVHAAVDRVIEKNGPGKNGVNNLGDQVRVDAVHKEYEAAHGPIDFEKFKNRLWNTNGDKPGVVLVHEDLVPDDQRAEFKRSEVTNGSGNPGAAKYHYVRRKDPLALSSNLFGHQYNDGAQGNLFDHDGGHWVTINGHPLKIDGAGKVVKPVQQSKDHHAASIASHDAAVNSLTGGIRSGKLSPSQAENHRHLIAAHMTQIAGHQAEIAKMPLKTQAHDLIDFDMMASEKKPESTFDIIARHGSDLARARTSEGVKAAVEAAKAKSVSNPFDEDDDEPVERDGVWNTSLQTNRGDVTVTTEHNPVNGHYIHKVTAWGGKSGSPNKVLHQGRTTDAVTPQQGQVAHTELVNRFYQKMLEKGHSPVLTGQSFPGMNGTIHGAKTQDLVGRDYQPGIQTFKNPLQGNGHSLVAYEWKNFQTHDGRRISNWEKAVENPHTGQHIVHQFHLAGPDGQVSKVSLETALTKMGYATPQSQKAVREIANSSMAIARYKMNLERLKGTTGSTNDRIHRAIAKNERLIELYHRLSRSDIEPAPFSAPEYDGNGMALSAQLANCPRCGSFDVSRTGNVSGGRSLDKCQRCGHAWTCKPGQLTAEQHSKPSDFDENGDNKNQNFPWDEKPLN